MPEACSPKHSSKTNEWYSPVEVVASARALMGKIDLDPASCEEANKTVRAERYYSKLFDGYSRPWDLDGDPTRVFLNPPGGRTGNESNQKRWWWKLVHEWMADRVREAIFVGFNMEILQTAQVNVPRNHELLTPMDFPFCVPAKRLRFGNGTSPTHGNVIVYLPPVGDHVAKGEDFRELFSPIGKVLTAHCAYTPTTSAASIVSTSASWSPASPSRTMTRSGPH